MRLQLWILITLGSLFSLVMHRYQIIELDSYWHDIWRSYFLNGAWNVQGYIYTVSVNSHTGSLSRTHKNKSSKSKSPITTIQYRTFSLVARCPVLLSCAQDGNLSFFRCVNFISLLCGRFYLTLICNPLSYWISVSQQMLKDTWLSYLL